MMDQTRIVIRMYIAFLLVIEHMLADTVVAYAH